MYAGSRMLLHSYVINVHFYNVYLVKGLSIENISILGITTARTRLNAEV